MPRALNILLSAQVVIIGIILFGDIGFDKPGKFGFDFGHFLLFAFALMTLFAVTTWIATQGRRWRLVVLNVVLLLLAFAGVMIFL